MIYNNDKVLFTANNVSQFLFLNFRKVQDAKYLYLTKTPSGKVNLNNIAYILASYEKPYLVIQNSDSLKMDKINFLEDNQIAEVVKSDNHKTYLKLFPDGLIF